MKLFSFLIMAVFCLPVWSHAQSADEKAIRDVLARQTEAWNRGNLDEFMDGYWKNDSLMFIGKNGVTYGWQNTLDNYKKGYKGPDEMGTLIFTLLRFQRVSREYYYVIGKWELNRKAGDVSGHYTLLWRKIKGKWVIISDHSS